MFQCVLVSFISYCVQLIQLKIEAEMFSACWQEFLKNNLCVFVAGNFTASGDGMYCTSYIIMQLNITVVAHKQLCRTIAQKGFFMYCLAEHSLSGRSCLSPMKILFVIK